MANLSALKQENDTEALKQAFESLLAIIDFKFFDMRIVVLWQNHLKDAIASYQELIKKADEAKKYFREV